MKFSPAHARKLASLSALGAGALVVGAAEADAGSITYSNFGGNPGKVGFSKGFNFSFTATNTSHGSVGFQFVRSSCCGGSSANARSVRFLGLGLGLNMNFATAGGLLKLFAAGSTFGGAFPKNTGTAAFGSWKRYVHSSVPGNYSTNYSGYVPAYTTFQHNAGPPGFANKYALFKFSFGGHSNFGWVQLGLQNSQFGSSTSGGIGPDLTVTAWAFDDSGNPIAAGDTGVPEPATFGMTGLAALALGAVGLRRWRAARSRPAA